MRRISLACRPSAGAGILAVGLLIFLANGLRAETMPPSALAPSVAAAIDAIASRSDQCPNVEALQSLADGGRDREAAVALAPAGRSNGPTQAGADPEHVVAVATYTAQRLRGGDRWSAAGGARDSRCNCIEQLTTALTSPDSASADKVRGAFADAFPDCDKNTTAAGEEDVTTGAPAPDTGLPEWKSLPGFGLFGDPMPACKQDCSAVEPPPAHDASRTAL